MRQALISALVLLALAAPAFAQQGSLQQPRTPDNGVGVDYSQPYVNDLLLRMQRFTDGGAILNGDRIISCEKQRMALSENPTDPALDQAYEACLDRQREQFEALRRFRANPGPGARPPLFIPDPNAPPLVRPIPPAPDHPNAQN
jgi:hypothetical protein